MERRIDRDAWAGLVRKLVTTRSRGNKSAFSRLVGVTARTLDRWLAAEVDVSEASVRAVARALELNAMDLLVGVGYYSPAEVTPAERAAADLDDEARRLIIETDFPDRIKMRMLQRLDDLRRRDRAREAEEVRFWIEQAGETTQDLGRGA